MERMSLFTILVNKFKMSTIIKDNRIRTRFIKIPMLQFKSHIHFYIYDTQNKLILGKKINPI